MKRITYIMLAIYTLAVVSVCVSPPWKAQLVSRSGSRHGCEFDSELYRFPNSPLWNRAMAVYSYYSRRGEDPPWECCGPDTRPLRVDFQRLGQQLIMITAVFGGTQAIVVLRLGRLGSV